MATQVETIEQPVTLTAGEDAVFTGTFNVTTAIPGGATFELRIFTQDWKTRILTVTSFTVVDAILGIVSFPLTASQTLTTIGRGRFRWGIWRTDTGSNKRLAGTQLTML